MDNQHRKITGYRELDKHEIEAINEIKSHGEDLRKLIDKLEKADKLEATDPRAGEALRWRAIARDQLQIGIMALTRSVALPESF